MYILKIFLNLGYFKENLNFLLIDAKQSYLDFCQKSQKPFLKFAPIIFL